MRRVGAYLLAGIVVVLATFAIAAIIPVPSVNAGPVARDGAAVQRVDRHDKGDRLDINISTIRKRPARPPQRKIMSGCEPVFSPLAAAGRADNFAGRCTAERARRHRAVG